MWYPPLAGGVGEWHSFLVVNAPGTGGDMVCLFLSLRTVLSCFLSFAFGLAIMLIIIQGEQIRPQNVESSGMSPHSFAVKN